MFPDISSIVPYLPKLVTLVGLVLELVGSLFLAYDLLGHQGGPLHKFLRLAVPGIIGAVALVPVFLLVSMVIHVALSSLRLGWEIQSPSTVDLFLVAPMTGAFFGVLNALYDAPLRSEKSGRLLSSHAFLTGFVLAIAFTCCNETVAFIQRPYGGLSPREFWVIEVFSTAVAAVTLGVAASLWPSMSRFPSLNTKPRTFTANEALVGALMVSMLVIIPNLATGVGAVVMIARLRTAEVLAANVLIGPLIGAISAAPAGAAIGGLWPRVFWWVDHAGKYQLANIGVCSVLLGFAAHIAGLVIS
jgi:hypothetical protein